MTDSNQLEAIDALLTRLNYQFSKKELLSLALTHTSFANEHAIKGEDNQRLEFLGDAVVGLVVAEALMIRLPQAAEGQLTSRRSALVKEESLAELARRVELGNALSLGHGEDKNNGRDRSSILADAVEAVIGAVYLDGGYEAARELVLNWLGTKLEDVVDGSRPEDVKTTLQEMFQARSEAVPQYQIVDEQGPDHAKIFEVEIKIGNNVLAKGRGRSKKEAEKDAAARALAAIKEQQ